MTSNSRQSGGSPKSARRGWRPRFRLGTLFLLVAFCGLAFGWWRDRQELQRQLQEAVHRQAESEEVCDVLRENLRGQWSPRVLDLAHFRVYGSLDRERLNLARDEDAKPPRVEPGLDAETARTRAQQRREALEQVICHPRSDEVERALAVDELLAHGRTAMPALTRALRAEDFSVRLDTAAALVGHGEAVKPLLLAEFRDGPAESAALAGAALRRLSGAVDPVPRLSELIQHPDPRTRAWALQELGDTENDAARQLLPEIRRALRGADAAERMAAAYAVARLAPRDEARRALAVARRSEQDPKQRQRLAHMILVLELRTDNEAARQEDADWAP